MPTYNLASFPIVLMMALSMLFLASTSCPAQDSTVQEPLSKKLGVAHSMPYWSHDATGYHPALCVQLENIGTTDLSGKSIKMQCRFFDLQLGTVMVAKVDKSYEFLPPKQFVYETFHGPLPYELPIDQNAFPKIEAKLMTRIGNVGESGTELLIIQKLDNVTMTDEQALQNIRNSYFPSTASKKHLRTTPAHEDPDNVEKPLKARALPLANTGKSELTKFASNPKMPGLNSDFLEFEQTYGNPINASIKEKGWSWIRYSKQDLPIDVFVGAKGAATKADIIVAKIPTEIVQTESQVTALAKAMSGKMRGQALEHPRKAVKYQQLSEQKIRRILITNMDTPGYRLCYVTPRGTSGDDNNYILILTKFTGDIPTMIPELIRKAPMMKFLYSALGLPEQD